MSDVRTETAKPQPATMPSRSGIQTGSRLRLADARLVLILLLAVLAGALAYQAPATANLYVGWLGDQLFLPTSEGLGAADNGSWYGDELSDHARSGRSRWTRQSAAITLPNLNPAGELALTIRAQGWAAAIAA